MEHEDTATRALTERPLCDLCGKRPAAVDGRLKVGHGGPSWCYACLPCWEEHGVGLGLGKGQRLFIDPD